MSEYRVHGTVVISCYTIVEAESEEEARRIAEGRDMCAVGDPERCGGDVREVWFHSGELDGTPEVEGVEPE